MGENVRFALNASLRLFFYLIYTLQISSERWGFRE